MEFGTTRPYSLVLLVPTLWYYSSLLFGTTRPYSEGYEVRNPMDTQSDGRASMKSDDQWNVLLQEALWNIENLFCKILSTYFDNATTLFLSEALLLS